MQKILKNSEKHQTSDNDWQLTVSMRIRDNEARLCLLKGLVVPAQVVVHLKVIRACHNPPVLIYCPPSLVQHFEAEAETLLRGAVVVVKRMIAEDLLIEAARNTKLFIGGME